MTLMQWGNSEGIQGRCDAKCHYARSPTCNCMCGGRYHGSGNTGTFDAVRREHGAEIVKAAEARAASQGLTLEAFLEQAALF